MRIKEVSLRGEVLNTRYILRKSYQSSISVAFVLALLLIFSACGTAPQTPSPEFPSSPTLSVSSPQMTVPWTSPTPTPDVEFGDIHFYLTYRGFDLDQAIDMGLAAEVDRYPSGMYEVFASFECSGMPPYAEVRMVWYRNGQVEGNEISQLADESGNCAVWSRLINDDGLPDGLYDFRVYYQERVVQHREIEIGGNPTVWPIAFTEENIRAWSSWHLPEHPTNRFDSPALVIYYVAWVADFPSGIPYRVEWYNNGELWDSGEYAWEHSDKTGWIGGWVWLEDGSPLPPGEWEVDIYIGEKLARIGRFVIED